MVQKSPMTIEGEQALRKELTHLKTVERKRLVEAIATARQLGDLKENAEYHAAREQQGFVEGRIEEIEAKLSNAQIIDVVSLAKSGRIVFGVTVNLVDLKTDETQTLKIVGDDEADVQKGKISIFSLMARALIGKNEGEQVEINVPSGDREYLIKQVLYI